MKEVSRNKWGLFPNIPVRHHTQIWINSFNKWKHIDFKIFIFSFLLLFLFSLPSFFFHFLPYLFLSFFVPLRVINKSVNWQKEDLGSLICDKRWYWLWIVHNYNKVIWNVFSVFIQICIFAYIYSLEFPSAK